MVNCEITLTLFFLYLHDKFERWHCFSVIYIYINYNKKIQTTQMWKCKCQVVINCWLSHLFCQKYPSLFLQLYNSECTPKFRNILEVQQIYADQGILWTTNVSSADYNSYLEIRSMVSFYNIRYSPKRFILWVSR